MHEKVIYITIALLGQIAGECGSTQPAVTVKDLQEDHVTTDSGRSRLTQDSRDRTPRGGRDDPALVSRTSERVILLKDNDICVQYCALLALCVLYEVLEAISLLHHTHNIVC
jgi:hypothetical protein